MSRATFLPRSQTPFGNASPRNSVSRAGGSGNGVSRSAFPNGVWERDRKVGHASAILWRVEVVFAEGLFDLLAMLGVILPGGIQIGLSQRRVEVVADPLVGHTEESGLYQHPDGDARVPNAGVASAHTGSLLDPARGPKVVG